MHRTEQHIALIRALDITVTCRPDQVTVTCSNVSRTKHQCQLRISAVTGRNQEAK